MLNPIKNIILGAFVISWLGIFLIFSLYVFPKQTIRAVDNYFLYSHSINFKDLENRGTFLGPILKFSELEVSNKNQKIFEARNLDIGIQLSLGIFFKEIIVEKLVLNEGFFRFEKSNENKISFPSISLANYFTFSIENFLYKKDSKNILINGSMSGSISESLSGQINLMHEDNLSTISLMGGGNNYNFSINLHNSNWFDLLPISFLKPISDLSFHLKSMGSINQGSSIIKGSIGLNEWLAKNVKIKKNYGSFEVKLRNGKGELALSKFLNPIIDESDPIKFDFYKKNIFIPSLILSNQILDLQKYKILNLSIKNFFLSFKQSNLVFSGLLADLDLENLYFHRILDISGNFSGNPKGINLRLFSDSTSLIKNSQQSILASIDGYGHLSDTGLGLKALIDSNESSINLNLSFNPLSKEPLLVELKGADASKKLILTSFPQSLSSVNNFIQSNISLSNKNNIYLKYSGGALNSNSKFQLKLFANQANISGISKLQLSLRDVLIEADKKNLYINSNIGRVGKISYTKGFGILNYQDQQLQFSTSHLVDLKDLVESNILPQNTSISDIQALHKGRIQFSSAEYKSAISAEVGSFSFPFTNEQHVNIRSGNFFITNLDRIFGTFSANLLNQDVHILLKGKELFSDFDINFLTTINIDPKKYIPQTDLLNIAGKDNFLVDLKLLALKKPLLKISSDLQEIKIRSPLKFLNKEKSKTLQTLISIEGFKDPALKLVNDFMYIDIKDLSIFEGYISLGGLLPEKYNFFRNQSGLNIFIKTNSFDLNDFQSISFDQSQSTNINFKNFAFEIDRLNAFENTFLKVSGLFEFNNKEMKGNINGKNLNLNYKNDTSGFFRIDLKNSTIKNINFFTTNNSSFNNVINSRITIENSNIENINISNADFYVLSNQDALTFNNIKMKSDLINISSQNSSSPAYLSFNKNIPLYKINGNFLVKDSKQIPFLRDYIDFSYFNGSLNLQWQNLLRLSHIEGKADFILKDLTIPSTLPNSSAFNLLGVLNLKNILGKLVNFDLSLDEYTSTQLSRVEANLLLSQSRLRLAEPLFIETNAAKMKWIGQINKNKSEILDDLDLNLDLRIRVGENIPWYAAILGGLPAVAGSAVLNEFFEEDINNLSNYQYEVTGNINKPQLSRLK